MLYLRNSIIAGSGAGDDCYGPLDQNSGNLSQDGSCSTRAGGDPLLDDLTGAPAYHSLRDGSPAVDAADPAFCLETDQVGTTRTQGGRCDIGAFESTTAAPAAIARGQVTDECTLADRIIAANTDAPAGACPAGDGDDTISLTKDITLSESLPPITSNIAIQGNGHTLDGANRYRIFDIGGGGYPKVVIKNMSLVNGNASGEYGGAIRLNSGELIISDAILRSNQAESGGAIATDEYTYLKIYNSRLSHNKAAAHGGAIYYSGCILVDRTVFFKQNSSILSQDDSRRGREITIAEPPRSLLSRKKCRVSFIHFLTH